MPLECIYKLTDRDGGKHFTKYYRFKNKKLLADDGAPKDLPAMENLGLSPLPDGTVRLFSEYKSKDLAYVGGTTTKYVPIGERVEVNVGSDPDITIVRRLKDQHVTNVVARQCRRLRPRRWPQPRSRTDCGSNCPRQRSASGRRLRPGPGRPLPVATW